MSEVVYMSRIEQYSLVGTIIFLIGIIVISGYFLFKNQPAKTLYLNGIFGKLTALFIYTNRRMHAITLNKGIVGWHDQKDRGVFSTNAQAAILPNGTPPIFIIKEDLAEAIDVKNITFKPLDEFKEEKHLLHFRNSESPRSIRFQGHIIDILGTPIEKGTVNVNPIRIQSLIAKFVDVATKKVNDYWVKRFQGGMAPGGGAGQMIFGILIGGVIGMIVGMMLGGGQMPSFSGFLPPGLTPGG